jgi:uncharacterized protein YjiS (DUF1127 family)
MSSIIECRESPATPGSRAALWLAGVADMLRQVWDFLERAAAGRRALQQLAGAADRMLKDIGLDRSDLRNAAAEPLYRDPTAILASRVEETRPRRYPRGRRVPARYY